MSKHPNVLAILAAVVLPFVLTACMAPGASNPNLRHVPQNTIDASNPRARLILGSRDLVGEIALLDVRLGSAGSLAKGEVSVQNLSNNRYSLEYQYAWEDRDGFSISENRVWKRFVLGPRELKSFRSVASDPRAYGFSMTVRVQDDHLIQQEKDLNNRQ